MFIVLTRLVLSPFQQWTFFFFISLNSLFPTISILFHVRSSSLCLYSMYPIGINSFSLQVFLDSNCIGEGGRLHHPPDLNILICGGRALLLPFLLIHLYNTDRETPDSLNFTKRETTTPHPNNAAF